MRWEEQEWLYLVLSLKWQSVYFLILGRSLMLAPQNWSQLGGFCSQGLVQTLLFFCLFNLSAFTLCLPFGVSLYLAFLQIPNSQQQISALPSVFFLHWHANTRKLWDSSSLWEVDAAQIPRRLHRHSCLTCPGKSWLQGALDWGESRPEPPGQSAPGFCTSEP